MAWSASLKTFVGKVDAEYWQRVLAYSLLNKEFKELKLARKFDEREKLWEWVCANFVSKTEPVTYVEFGVHEGRSIKYLASILSNPASRFIGLDSF